MGGGGTLDRTVGSGRESARRAQHSLRSLGGRRVNSSRTFPQFFPGTSLRFPSPGHTPTWLTPTLLSFLRASTHSVDGMECPSHWPDCHSLRWHCPLDWLATPGSAHLPSLGLPGSPPPSTAQSPHPCHLPPHPCTRLRAGHSSAPLSQRPGRRAGPAPGARGSINTAALQAAGEPSGGGAVVRRCRDPLWAEIPLAKPERPFHQLLGSGSPGAPSAPGAKARGEEPATGGGQAEFAYLPRSPKQVLSRRAQGASDEGGEPGAPFRPQGAVGLRQRGDGAALSGPTWPQPGRLGHRDRRGGGSALQGGRGGDRRAGAVPVVRYEPLLQSPAEAGAHHPAQQESQQSGDPAARYRLHPGPAAGAGDASGSAETATGSAETATTARATAPPGRILSSSAASDPAHCAQYPPGVRPPEPKPGALEREGEEQKLEQSQRRKGKHISKC
ncbi:translation initiation factor IF-2 [Marmota marmota marmota]|uniref:translation initiation factor IF-2 n=1 Tax=Marmota marmota marmota TaxID=9994 RepID=UPI002092E00D|nr:translation initiation factor IF-2 [Marmota marmota marmota]